MDPDPTGFLAVGRIRRPHGVHGEILADVTTDFPDRVVSGIDVGLGAEAPERWVHLEGVRFHKGCFLIRIEGVSSREEADELRGRWLFLPPQERSQLPPNYYYEHELAGLACVLRDGSALGVVVELGTATGTPMLTVRTGAGEVLVPFISPIVVAVDLDGRRVVIDPPTGLFDVDAL